ncbi:MAG: SUMF1/EgtB/PvdO family nonheme iron enzyme [Solirubrobacterales bacterium]
MIATSPALTDLKESLAERLEEARRMTLRLIEPLSDDQLNKAYSDILSPLAWDLGHIGNFEELWLVQTIGRREPMDGDLGRFYDAIENPRAARNELPILRGDELRSYMAEVRERTLEVLEEIELEDTDDRLLRYGFVYELILAHEHQHSETMLQLLQMVDYPEPVDPDPAPAAEPVSEGPDMVPVDGGEYEIGAWAQGFAYDNERPRQVIELAPFEIDRTPVTNEAYAGFVAETGAEPPLYWQQDGQAGWVRAAMGQTTPLDPAHPVVHVDYASASAFAEWVGKRLPTEIEWEAASQGANRERANLDCLGFGTAPAGAYGDAASDVGAVQMLGDVWEWTSSDFSAYPGFEAFPYDEYSKAFFGPEHKVLRGGSWATRRSVIRRSFRNWDLPERRQIFSGLRCVRDV